VFFFSRTVLINPIDRAGIPCKDCSNKHDGTKTFDNLRSKVKDMTATRRAVHEIWGHFTDNNSHSSQRRVTLKSIVYNIYMRVCVPIFLEIPKMFNVPPPLIWFLYDIVCVYRLNSNNPVVSSFALAVSFRFFIHFSTGALFIHYCLSSSAHWKNSRLKANVCLILIFPRPGFIHAGTHRQCFLFFIHPSLQPPTLYHRSNALYNLYLINLFFSSFIYLNRTVRLLPSAKITPRGY